eukprot:TRINITY_DN25472_c0_g1_i1.p1 TRINITY_DN25472_c0_g1~~TRINITY_DN25472_c0_g1_i1.p1  ORF type:complete len:159 (+),score=6.23 TRINITY_DN25472_c0_g1_i1:32-478(+)
MFDLQLYCLLTKQFFANKIKISTNFATTEDQLIQFYSSCAVSTKFEVFIFKQQILGTLNFNPIIISDLSVFTTASKAINATKIHILLQDFQSCCNGAQCGVDEKQLNIKFGIATSMQHGQKKNCWPKVILFQCQIHQWHKQQIIVINM